MASNATHQITDLLVAWADGEETSRERLAEAIYPELRRLAAFHLSNPPGEVSWQATELAHEVYFQLCRQTRISWQNRAQLFAILSQLLRRALVDEARRRSRQKRGGGQDAVTLDEVRVAIDDTQVDILALDHALTELAEIDAVAVQVVEALFFAGLSHDEASAALGIGRATVGRRWRFARAWLQRKLQTPPAVA